MRVERLLLALKCLLGFVHYSGALSTCSPLDLELIKRKRIEAIRGQILSKLRLPKEPEVDEEEEGDSQKVPVELLSVYNSTVELSEEKSVDPEHAPIEESEEEEYYAKEVHKFTMKKMENNEEKHLWFNITEMNQTLGSEHIIYQAELRLRINDFKVHPKSEQRLELHQVIGDKTRYLDSRLISKELDNKWLAFDVTQTLKDWLRKSEKEQGFQLKLNCGCDESKDEFQFKISGLSPNRLDLESLQTQLRPHILVMSLPVDHHLKSRSKRQAEKEAVCTGSDGCCVRSLYIDFRKDLGWKWIHEPSGYYANFCTGSCSYFWTSENNKYSQVLALYRLHNPGASAQPCCVPQVLDPLPILYYVGRQHKVEQLSNMIVKTCKCC